jgi:hypothetical protein
MTPRWRRLTLALAGTLILAVVFCVVMILWPYETVVVTDHLTDADAPAEERDVADVRSVQSSV